MELISKRSRCFLILGLMTSVSSSPKRLPNRQNIKSTPAIQEVDSHAMILLEKPTTAFNVHQAGLDIPPAHVCRLPPGSPGTSEQRPLQVSRVYRTREINKSIIKPCLTWCNRHGLRSDKGGYKKAHPFWPRGHSACSGHGGHILHFDWQAVLTCCGALLLCLWWKFRVCRHVQ